jgi:hypothetical protein
MPVDSRSQLDSENSNEQIPCWETDSRSIGQEIPRLLWNQNVHICNIPPLDIVWARWIQSATYFLKNKFNIIFPSTPNFPELLSSFRVYTTKIVYAFLISFMHVTRPVHLITHENVYVFTKTQTCKVRNL